MNSTNSAPAASPNAAIIVAGGRGQRAGAGLPKQYRLMPAHDDSRMVLTATLAAFAAHDEIGPICVVIHPDDQELYAQAVAPLPNADLICVHGGETRQDSVMNGLKALQSAPIRQVLIHDAARPYVSASLISRCLAGLGSAAGAIPAQQVTDTLKRAENGAIVETVPRQNLWQAQTPQAFNYAAIFTAHQRAPQGLTDDAAVAELAGMNLAIVAGEASNIKLTHEADFQPPLGHAPTWLPRHGTGFDVHRLDVPGSASEIMLCGVGIAHDRALIGHSDADVGLHAITDALLGALAEGDIGDHFPDSDAAHKNRPSRDFLKHAVRLTTQHQAEITHVDVTLICEAPKIGPHRQAMRHAIAEITGLAVSCVSVKATTSEGLGFTGRGEGIACQASVTVLMPRTSPSSSS